MEVPNGAAVVLVENSKVYRSMVGKRRVNYFET